MKTFLISLFILSSITVNAQTWTTAQLSVKVRELYANDAWLKSQKKIDSITIVNLKNSNANLVNQNNQLSSAIVFNKSWSDSLYRSIGTLYLDTTRNVSFGRYLDTIYIKTK